MKSHGLDPAVSSIILTSEIGPLLFVWILLTIDMGGDRHCHYPKGDLCRKDDPTMNRKKRLKLLLDSIVLLMVALVGYKVYLFVYEADYEALNADRIP